MSRVHNISSPEDLSALPDGQYRINDIAMAPFTIKHGLAVFSGHVKTLERLHRFLGGRSIFALSAEAFKCFCCESTVSGETPYTGPNGETLCSDCYCEKSPTKLHDPDWDNVSSEYEKGVHHIMIHCKHCGHVGTIGSSETLNEMVDWF